MGHKDQFSGIGDAQKKFVIHTNPTLVKLSSSPPATFLFLRNADQI